MFMQKNKNKEKGHVEISRLSWDKEASAKRGHDLFGLIKVSFCEPILAGLK